MFVVVFLNKRFRATFNKEEEDLFTHLIRINNTLAKSTIFTD